jgi:hypothetical protein
MKPIVLLNDEPETVRLMLAELHLAGWQCMRLKLGRAAIAIAGVIRVRGLSTAKDQTKRTPMLRLHYQSNSEVDRWISDRISPLRR